MQIPLWGDLARTDMMLFCVVGTVYGLCVAISGKSSVIDCWLLLPAVFVAVMSIGRWVPGYTEYEVLKYVGMAGISMMAMRSNPKLIYWALIATVFLQFFYLFVQFPWAIDLQAPYGYGVFRHKIRFSTVMFAGLMGAFCRESHLRQQTGC
jgi:hypothetical protein